MTDHGVEITYVPNHVDFAKIMMSDDVQEAAIEAGTDLVFLALTFAPTSDPARKGSSSGPSYRESFEVRPHVVVLSGGPRRSVLVANTSAYAAQVEWGDLEHRGRPQGGSHGIPHRPLGRAAAALGATVGGA